MISRSQTERSVNSMKKTLSNLYSKRSSIAKIALLVMLFFGVNVYLTFATDTYAIFEAGLDRAGKDVIRWNARLVLGLFYELHDLSGLSNEAFYCISSALALIFLGISIWIYQGILEKYEIKENTRILMAFAGIANIFIVEYFMFLEKCVFMLSILFEVIGVYWIEKFFSEKKKRYFVFAVLSMISAIFTYQGTIALFVVLSIPFAMKNAENFKKYFFNGLAIGLAYIIPVIVNLAVLRLIIKSTRLVTKTDYIANLVKVLQRLYPWAADSYDILPRYQLLLITLVIFVSAVVWALICRQSAWRIFNACIIVTAGCLFSTATIIQGTGWWAARTVYSIASIPAVLAIDLFVNKEDAPVNESLKKAVRYISAAALAVLMVFQYFSFNKIYIDKYRLNALDQYRYQYIGQAIREYQDDTGTEIKSVAFYTDEKVSNPQYSNLFHTGDLIVSAFTTSWSDLRAMNYYLHTNYKKADPVEEYVEYFAGKNWDTLSKDQLIFDGDTLHICVY